MKLEWTNKALSDLTRLYDFLAPVNRRAAARVVQHLVSAPSKLLEHPRVGERLDDFGPREVRRLLVDRYEIRYEPRHHLCAPRVAHARGSLIQSADGKWLSRSFKGIEAETFFNHEALAAGGGSA